MRFVIKQAPGNLRGFGFSLVGGRDQQTPLRIERVSAGSSADDADLQVDDEIIQINNESVESYFRSTLNRLIQQSVKNGQITLLVRRQISSAATTATEEKPQQLVQSANKKMNNSPKPVPAIQPKPVASPALSTSSTASSNNGPRYCPPPPVHSNGNKAMTNSSSSNVSKEDSQENYPLKSTPAPLPPGAAPKPSFTSPNSNGAILVRGGSTPKNSTGTPNSNTNTPNASMTSSTNNTMIPQPWVGSPKEQIRSQTTPQAHQQRQPLDSASTNGNTPKTTPPKSDQQQTRSVSSRELCSACQASLGAGPAMAIERLGLFYHVRCFRCSVCKISLSNGATGVDVRVKGARLHCQHCNSNDESKSLLVLMIYRKKNNNNFFFILF